MALSGIVAPHWGQSIMVQPTSFRAPDGGSRGGSELDASARDDAIRQDRLPVGPAPSEEVQCQHQ
jgi:hypothetical protein